MPPFLHIEEPPRPAPQGFALFALGFRPFYLLASVLASASVLLWALQFSGWLGWAYLRGPVWHAHEMVFGFALAVIVGFLFTAGRNWSNLPTPTGWQLAALCAVWLAARVLVLTPYGVAAAVINVAFPLLAAIGLAIPFFKAKLKRNYFFLGLLGVMALATALFHLAELRVMSIASQWGLKIALAVVLFIMCVMGGRVIPMFTNNGVPGTQASRHDTVEKVALASVFLLLVCDVLTLDGRPVAALALVAAVAHLWRWWLWQPWRTWRVPLVWVLHAAYVWIPIHLCLRAAGELGLIATSLATHALTAGAIGGLTIGMMTRTARGHTGRLLRADPYEVAAYVLVLLAALVRVFVPLLAPSLLVPAVVASGVLWSLGFGVYAVRYWPILSRPRIDGRPG